MYKRLKSFVKYNPLILKIYRIFGNCIIKVLSIFVKADSKKILFMSFGGQKYDDSPRALYEQMKCDPFFSGYKMVWAFTNPKNFEYVDCKKVKTDTVKFYITALSSKIWINNSSVERGLNIKQKAHIEINTWHGTPLKKMGSDIPGGNAYSVKQGRCADIYCAQSEYDRDIWVRFFNTQRDKIILSDLPRNDSLLKYSNIERCQIKDCLKLPIDKKIILYAPTFREYNRDSTNSCYICPPINKDKWKETLGNDYIVLVRAHYEVVKILGFEDDGFFVNVSSYPRLNDLMAISDCLISDYSSIYFDYSITEKPMFNFSYDYEEYNKFRGLYLDLNESLPCNVNLTEDTLLEEILTYDENEYVNNVKKFKQTFAPCAGGATAIVIQKLKDIIE